MLHLFAFAPTDETLLKQALTLVGRGDDVVLLEQAALFTRDSHAFAPLAHLAGEATLYLLSDASPADGLPVQQLTVDNLVTLSERQPCSVSWYA